MKLNADAQFFFDHAGYSWDPQTEAQEQGRERCALNLAAAEGIARNAGVSFHWEQDPYINSSDFSDDEPYALWQCTAFDCTGKAVAGLGGVDFGRDGSPYGDDYRRVCEAEIASEHVTSELFKVEG